MLSTSGGFYAMDADGNWISNTEKPSTNLRLSIVDDKLSIRNLDGEYLSSKDNRVEFTTDRNLWDYEQIGDNYRLKDDNYCLEKNTSSYGNGSRMERCNHHDDAQLFIISDPEAKTSKIDSDNVIKHVEKKNTGRKIQLEIPEPEQVVVHEVEAGSTETLVVTSVCTLYSTQTETETINTPHKPIKYSIKEHKNALPYVKRPKYKKTRSPKQIFNDLKDYIVDKVAGDSTCSESSSECRRRQEHKEKEHSDSEIDHGKHESDKDSHDDHPSYHDPYNDHRYDKNDKKDPYGRNKPNGKNNNNYPYNRDGNRGGKGDPNNNYPHNNNNYPYNRDGNRNSGRDGRGDPNNNYPYNRDGKDDPHSNNNYPYNRDGNRNSGRDVIKIMVEMGKEVLMMVIILINIMIIIHTIEIIHMEKIIEEAPQIIVILMTEVIIHIVEMVKDILVIETIPDMMIETIHIIEIIHIVEMIERILMEEMDLKTGIEIMMIKTTTLA